MGVLLTSKGTAVACGDHYVGRCDIPALEAGLTYTQVAAGAVHTVLLTSKGTAVACGNNVSGQCDIPVLDSGLMYVQPFLLPALVLGASWDGNVIRFLSLGGEDLCQIPASAADLLAEIGVRLLSLVDRAASRVDVVFPGGRLMSSILSQDPGGALRVAFWSTGRSRDNSMARCTGKSRGLAI